MRADSEHLQDPQFLASLRRRSRLRWSFSGFLIVAYLLFGVCGLYFPDSYASIMPSTGIPLGLFMGLCLIALAMLLSVVYIRLVNRIDAEHAE